MGVKYTNNAKTTISSGINNSVTTIPVASSSGFPSLSGSDYFYATLDDATNIEVVKVTAVSGTNWTVVRAQDDTTARAFDSGDDIELRLNAALLTDVVNDAMSDAFTRQAFTGDGSETNFTLSKAPATENDLIVFIEGVFQTQSAYSVSGTTLTFSAAPANSREIIVYNITAAVNGDSLSQNNFTGDGSDTTFTLGTDPLHENNTMVFLDGVYQHKSTYSVSGTTLTFSTAPASGVAIECITHTQTEVNTPASNSVVTASIVDDNVTQAKIADDAVGADQLAASAVVTASIVDDNVTQAKIADDAVGADQLASSAVVTASIVDDAVTTAKIADDQVTLAKMAGLARGKIIYGDSSGNPAALALGSNGQVLKSDGTDIAWGTDSTVAALTSEEVQDIVGAMFSSNTETGITATYQDGDGTVDLVIGADSIVSSMLDTNIDIAGTFDVTGATTLDSTLSVAGNVSIGVTPKTWHADWEVLQIGERASFYSQASTTTGIGENVYYDSGWKAIATAAGSLYQQDSGNHHFYTMASVSADATSSPSEKFTILNNGNVGIGITTPNESGFGATSSVLSIAGTAQDAFGVLELISTDVTSSNRIGEIRFGNLDAGSSFASNAGIRATRDGADNSSALSLWTTNAGTFAEVMHLSANKDVGIGVSPVTNSRLTVKTQGDGTFPIRVVNSADTDMLFGVYESSDGDGNNGMVYINDGAGNTDVKLSTNGASWFNGGKLGIGETDPNEPLTIRSSAENVDTVLIEIGNDLHASNTKDAWIKYVGGAAQTDHSWATGILSNTFSIKQVGARATTPSNGADRLKLDATGCMQLHSNGSGDTTIKFYEGSTIKWWVQNDTGGSPGSDSFWIGDEENDNGVYVQQDGSSWSGISDERLKRNWTNLENATDKIKTLTKVGTFQRRGKTTGNWSDNREVGLSAQEVEAILPEAVTTGGDIEFASDDKVTGVKGMAYEKLVPLLVKSIQELEARIKTLEDA